MLSSDHLMPMQEIVVEKRGECSSRCSSESIEKPREEHIGKPQRKDEGAINAVEEDKRGRSGWSYRVVNISSWLREGGVLFESIGLCPPSDSSELTTGYCK